MRKSVFYDEIDAVLGCRDFVTLKNVQEAGDSSSTTPRSADSESPLNVSVESSSAIEPKESVLPLKSCLERKKGQGQRKRKPEDADGEMEEHFKRAYDEIKSQGERVASYMEKMQELQMQQMQMMNQFMGNFLQAFNSMVLSDCLCYREHKIKVCYRQTELCKSYIHFILLKMC